MGDKALIIDDDPGIIALLRFGLKQDGFTVITVDEGSDALKTAYESRPDIVILEVLSRRPDGWVVCRRLREMSDLPIVVLSVSADENDVIKALSLGADEYVTKPCGLGELKARIRAVLRRARMDSSRDWETVYEDGQLRINTADGTVTRNGKAVHLTPTESSLLMSLVSCRGEVIPHRELLIRAWGQEYADAGDQLCVYIRQLRQKLEEDPSNPHYILTRWGVGYFFRRD